MRADIVDRCIEHGTAKFIVDGGRCTRVKYDDYNRDEIGSRGSSAALGKYICMCVCIYVYFYTTVIENIRKDFKLQQCFVPFFVINVMNSESNPTGNDLQPAPCSVNLMQIGIIRQKKMHFVILNICVNIHI